MDSESVLLKVTPTTMQFRCVYLIIINSFITLWISLLVSGWSYSYVCNDIVSDCNDRDSFTVTMAAIINAIKHLKPGKSDGFNGLSTDYFINGSPLLS